MSDLTSRAYRPMTPAQIAESLGLPMTRQGQPAMADNVPSRFIQLEEARARGWSMYWAGAACRRGHQAARYVANPRRCSGCVAHNPGTISPMGPRSEMSYCDDL